jgi:hypothetical protein
MQENNLEQLIKALRDESEKHRYSSKPLSFDHTEAYQAILLIGKDALPILFQELERSFDFWLLYILRDITGIDVINDQNRGNIDLMTQAWLDWAKHQN